jgi:hypothetical protein
LCRAAHSSKCSGGDLVAALSAHTDLEVGAIRVFAEELAAETPSSHVVSRQFRDAKWRASLVLSSSLTGEAMLPLVHVALSTANSDGSGPATHVMELTLPELRALRQQVKGAIQALDRA